MLISLGSKLFKAFIYLINKFKTSAILYMKLRGRAISLWLYKENNKLRDLKKYIYSTYSPLSLIFLFLNLCGGTLGTAATAGLLYQPRMIGDGDCAEIGGMKIGRGN
jgi:hypothetical protein